MYVKTQWVDNTTPIDKDNLNKIEQGIYDNSLVVDAVTNTLNPTDTETYKTAELTEGQITDVIGVNDIVIKGQTEQDGTPTPSAPVDVNVVSGSNVVNTNNKNLLKISGTSKTINGITFTQNNDGSISAVGTATADTTYISNNIQPIKENIRHTLTGCPSGGSTSTYRLLLRCLAENGTTYTATISNTGGSSNVTPPSDSKYMRGEIWVYNGQTINKTFYPQLELGSTATTYEPHQGKELPLDLPVENLFDIKKITENTAITDSGQTATSSVSNLSNYIKVKNSTSYTLTYEYSTLLNQSQRNVCFYNDRKEFIESIRYTPTNKTNTISTPINGTYLRFSYDKNCTDIKLQETNSQTTPIELCKIGNYQDYFYKSGSKWYLHKEIGKAIFNGSESWVLNTDNGYRFYTGIITSIIKKASELKCDKFVSSTQSSDLFLDGHVVNTQTGNLSFCKSGTTTVADWKTWLASNNVTVYYPLATATDTEITDTTLISQLEAIYNAPLYEQTNITQTNNDLPMVLDITACKDNINGIKAFIRK